MNRKTLIPYIIQSHVPSVTRACSPGRVGSSVGQAPAQAWSARGGRPHSARLAVITRSPCRPFPAP